MLNKRKQLITRTSFLRNWDMSWVEQIFHWLRAVGHDFVKG